MLEICHQHGCSFKVDHTIAACLNLLQRRRVDGDRRLRRGGCRRGLLDTTTAATTLRNQGNPAIFGVNSTVMAQEKVAANKGTPAF
jgi:hypothetical protein